MALTVILKQSANLDRHATGLSLTHSRRGMRRSPHFAKADTLVLRNGSPISETTPIGPPFGVIAVAVAFGDIQRNRLRGAKQLVPRVAIDAFQTFGYFVRPSHVLDRNQVNIEFLMPELHRFSDYNNNNNNDNDNYNES